MKKIYRPTFKESLGINKGFFKDLFNSEEEQSIYNQVTFLFLTIIISAIMGFFNSRAFILSISLSLYLFVTYKKTSRMIEGLNIKRRFPPKVNEGDNINVEYEVSNYSQYDILDFSLLDSFNGTREGQNKIFFTEKVKTGTRHVLHYETPINEGMGLKNFDKLELTITDDLGFFKYSLVDSSFEDIEVFPKVNKIPSYHLPIARFSNHFGEQDIASRGDSVNFLGTRKYVYGDPVKRINWRQSIKSSDLIVNYFEKNINKTFVILMNTDYRLHSGIGHFSTHEYLRDMALSIMGQNISNGNEITLVTNDKKFPKGSGQRFINQMELEMFNLKLTLDEQAQNFVLRGNSLCKNFAGDESSIVYLTPIVTGPLFEKNMESLRILRRKGFEVKVVWVNAFNHLAKKILFGSEQSIRYRQSLVQKLEKKWKQIFKNEGIGCLALNINEKELYSEVKLAMEDNQ